MPVPIIASSVAVINIMTTRDTGNIPEKCRLNSMNEQDALLKRVREEILTQNNHDVDMIVMALEASKLPDNAVVFVDPMGDTTLLESLQIHLSMQKHHGVDLIVAPVVDGTPGHGVSSPVRAGCSMFNSDAIILDALEQEMHITEIDTAKRKDRPWYRRGRF